MKQICVIGAGYVGLVTAACFAELGNRVLALDIDEKRIENLRKGIMPFHEPGLEDLVAHNMHVNHLIFTSSYPEALQRTDFVFIAVATPSDAEGKVDMQYVEMAARTVALNMSSPLIIVNKSTVPVGTGDLVYNIVSKNQPRPIQFSVVSCPEFLREGTAIQDFLQPHRIVLGSDDREACARVAELHLPLRAPIITTDLHSAEMIKYASNAFLAAKVTFINEIADICEAYGADVKEVAAGMGFDKRIGTSMLEAGLGWGGSCFPKDVRALAQMAREKQIDLNLLNTVNQANFNRRKTVVRHLTEMLGSLQGRTIGLLGLAFKPNTDDMREAPSIDIAQKLLAGGAAVRACDPVAVEVARPLMPDVQMYTDPYEMALGCDALLVVTEWNAYKTLDLERIRALMKSPLIYDGRNIYNPTRLRALGFTYRGIGRGFNGG
jgi:UDPglucose 6-dehydrogenase